jgi:hypothetical protein
LLSFLNPSGPPYPNTPFLLLSLSIVDGDFFAIPVGSLSLLSSLNLRIPIFFAYGFTSSTKSRSPQSSSKLVFF